MDRRNFLMNGGLGLVAFTLSGRNTYAFLPGVEAAGSCVPTTADILGPFYRNQAPFRSNLTVPGDPGTRLDYKGKVMDHNCNAISGATVDVWQADDSGAYDNSTSQFKYRGKQTSAADGSYSFNSIKAGWYLNGSQYRPSHIHFRVTAPGHTELITQLYFQNDPYIPNDPWASDPSAQLRIVPVTSVGGIDTANFDIYLQGNGTGMLEQEIPSPVKLSQNPFHDQVSFVSTSESLISLELMDVRGQLVYSQYDIRAENLSLHLGYLAKGIYYARVQTSKNIYVHKLMKD
jgi:protocatechuate 3,4-dioxygenase beta subunit